MNLLSRVVSLSLVFSLVVTFSLGQTQVSAESDLTYTQDDVEELANVLELLFDKGQILDHNGDWIGFDEDILEQELLDTDYSFLVDDLKEQGMIIDDAINSEIESNIKSTNYSPMAKSPRDAFLDRCVLQKLNDSYGVAATTAIVNAIKNKQWTKAATRLIRLGVRAAPPVIIANLGWIITSCLHEANKRGL